MPKNLRVNHEYVSMHPQNIITRLQSGESWEGVGLCRGSFGGPTWVAFR